MNETAIKENKTVLELEYQYFLNYINILVVTIISILITVWLSSDIIIKDIKYKFILTIALVYCFLLFMLLLHDKLNEIKRKISELF